MKKRFRKQPRKLTPPLVLRQDDGDRHIIEVDMELFTYRASRSLRITAILELAPGLKIRVGSRSLNKRRVTVLRIEPVAGENHQNAVSQPVDRDRKVSAESRANTQRDT